MTYPPPAAEPSWVPPTQPRPPGKQTSSPDQLAIVCVVAGIILLAETAPWATGSDRLFGTASVLMLLGAIPLLKRAGLRIGRPRLTARRVGQGAFIALLAAVGMVVGAVMTYYAYKALLLVAFVLVMILAS